MLSSGPGPGSLLAAAGAWNSLSTEYSSLAEELSELLAEMQIAAWQGPSAEAFVAAYLPYLAWLTQASANSSAASAQHETAAAAYTAALAAMPTLPELAANHAVHGVLLATNFLGINTIPIALNEADYARMWVQAATTMSTYQTVASTAVAATQPTDPAPTIQKSDAQTQAPSSSIDLSGDNPLGLPQWLQNFLNELGISNTQVAHDPTIDNAFDNVIANWLQNLGYNWNPAAGTLNGATYDTYTNPGQAAFWVARVLELTEDFQQFGQDLVTNPAGAFQYLVSLELFDWPLHLEEIGVWLAQNPALLAAVASPAIAPAGAGLLGLAGLAGIPPAPVVPALVPAAAATPVLPVTGTAAPTFAGTGGAAPGTTPAPSPAPTASTVAGPAPPSPPPAAGGAGFLPPYAIGPPGIGVGSGMSAGAASSAKRKTPEAESAAAVAAAAAREQARARRRRRATQDDYRDKFMDMDVEVDPDWAASPGNSTVASDRGTGDLGFTGTVSKGSTQAAGLATLSDNEFGGGPRMPMLPNTWGFEAPEGDQH